MDLLDNDISRIVNRVGKRSNDQVHTKELKILRERKNQTEVALQIIDDRIAETSAQIEEARKKL